jgi:hypothetical protein
MRGGPWPHRSAELLIAVRQTWAESRAVRRYAQMVRLGTWRGEESHAV